tara:strand:+ start:52 stop:474 length:423 start_codon:yes stop_codon:yes gene_type:complete
MEENLDQEVQQEQPHTEQPTQIEKKSFTWIWVVVGIITLLAVIGNNVMDSQELNVFAFLGDPKFVSILAALGLILSALYSAIINFRRYSRYKAGVASGATRKIQVDTVLVLKWGLIALIQLMKIAGAVMVFYFLNLLNQL